MIIFTNKESLWEMNSLLFPLQFQGFIKSTNHRPTDHWPTDHLPTDPPTHRPPTHQPNDAVIPFRRLENRNIFPLQNIKLRKCKTFFGLLSRKSLIYSVLIFNPWKPPWNWIAFYQNSFVISPDEKRLWMTCKRDLYVKSYCFSETIA